MCAEIEMTLTIVPPASRRSMSRTAACMMKKGPRRLVATWASNISGVVSRRVPRSVRAAAFTTQSTRPKALIVSVTEATA